MTMHAENDFGDMHVVMDITDENVTFTVTTPSWRGQYTSHVILPLDVLEWVVQNLKPAKTTCPDGGTCHHECTVGCFRVLYAGPLSGVYNNDEWPAEVYEANVPTDGHM